MASAKKNLVSNSDISQSLKNMARNFLIRSNSERSKHPINEHQNKHFEEFGSDIIIRGVNQRQFHALLGELGAAMHN